MKLFERKPRYRLFDNQFHGYSSCSTCYKSIKPSYFFWDRKGEQGSSFFYTDSSLKEVKKESCHKNIAWLLESPLVFPDSLDFIDTHYTKFDYVLTHQQRLLEKDSRFLFSPVGGSWIKKSQWRIYQKTKICSCIASQKNHYEGHRLRHEVARQFSDSIGFYGYGYQPVKHKVQALKDYSYSIVIENCRSDFYFTEKIIDAFACGTIPIYWGCPSIERFFDPGGIISFQSLDDLPKILSSLSPEDYRGRIESIRKNFEEAKKYRILEDWMWKEYQETIF